MANGLLQGDWGDVLADVKVSATTEMLSKALERLVIALTNPLNISQQIQITWKGAAGAAISITAADNATPQAIGIQIGQGGPTAIMGIGNASQGLTANCLNNRDIHQTQDSDTIARFSAAASNRPYSKLATGLATTGIATGKPSSDRGTMTAGPGETMPNATVRGFKRVAMGNLIVEGVLTTALTAATHFATGATTATAQGYKVDPLGTGNLVVETTHTLTNRDTTLAAPIGSQVIALWCNGELRPIWCSCGAVS